MDFVLSRRNAAQRIASAMLTKNVFNLANVSAHRRSTWMLTTEISVRALASGSLVESMPGALQPILRSACARSVTKAIL